MGGNLKILKWLVDHHHCPLKLINTGNRNKVTEDLITTSQNRSVLDIAIVHQHVDILRYLVQHKKVPVNDRKNKNQASLTALEAVLKVFPETSTSKCERISPSAPPLCCSPACSSYRRKADLKKRHSKPCSHTTLNLYNDDEGSVDSIDIREGDADDEQSISTTVEDPVRNY